MGEKQDDRSLSVGDLRRSCDPDGLPFKSTAEVEPIAGVIGQDDAIEALRFGLEFSAPGQNIYVRGLGGTGRMTLVRRLLEEVQPPEKPSRDFCYVHNFRQTDRPGLISLKRGDGRRFKVMMDRLVEFIVEQLGPSLGSDNMRARRADIDEEAQAELRRLGEPFEDELRSNGLALVPVQMGPTVQPTIMPVVKGEPKPLPQIEAEREDLGITSEQIEEYRRKIGHFARQFEDVSHKIQEFQSRHREAMRSFYEKEATALVAPRIAAIKEALGEGSVERFLDDLSNDLITERLAGLGEDHSFTHSYRVNLVLDHEQSAQRPIIVESSPNLANLLGTIEREFVPGGAFRTDHMMIQAGSLLLAEGGYLVLQARDVLAEMGAWKILMRTLRTGKLEIIPSELVAANWFGPQLKPQAIPIDVKVILIGEPGLYNMLDAADPDFSDLFKVLADFDSTIPRNEEGANFYAGVLAHLAKFENLLDFSVSGVATLIEHGSRIAGRRDQLTARFGRLADIAREAAYLARKEGSAEVGKDEVRRAIDRGRHRANLPARRFRKMIADGTIGVKVQGETIGQINGLAVIQSGPLTYGFPNRITATMGAGTAGAVNIEREANLSGAIHTKGFYILGGLLRHLLRTDHPLAFSASIAFEQSYGGIDGDSASTAEICCLISALTDVPLRQDLAVTGAIDQLGNIQPIGAVAEKIEGFFLVCKEAGLTGTQGVVIPRTNVDNLMLHPEIVAACAEGSFQVWAIDTIYDALELFTGWEAGRADEKGDYAQGTLLHRAEARALAYWKMAAGKNGAAR
jgi:lon-related putative ATP-dependent protease